MASRCHFVEVADDSRAVCGYKPPADFVGVPIIFRDLELWTYWETENMGVCYNCRASLWKAHRAKMLELVEARRREREGR